jgi:hypothetical protein
VKQRDDQVKLLYEWFMKMSDQNHQCLSIHLDNSGENKKFQQKMQTNGFWAIKFQYTSPRTPEQNGKVECGFATILGRARSMGGVRIHSNSP